MARENVLIVLFFVFVLVIPALMVIGVYGKLFSGLFSKSSKKAAAAIETAAADDAAAQAIPDPKPHKTDAE